MKKYELTTAQRDRLLDLLREERAGVADGTITGYGQTREDDLEDLDEIITELEG